MATIQRALAQLLERAVVEAQQSRRLPSVALPEITVERPQNPVYGDFATSLPLRMARAASTDPMAIARILAELLPKTEYLAKVEPASPGFINFSLEKRWLTRQVEEILAQADSYGSVALGNQERVQIEFVSVNPTGPLHVGHGRGAVLGSTLANVLSAAGYRVEKEYYVNDAGNQMDAFYRSLFARYQQALGRDAQVPEEGYHGAYLAELAGELRSELGDRFLGEQGADGVAALGKRGMERIISGIKEDLERLGVTFDVWFHEQSLYDSGRYAEAMAMLRQRGYISEKEGAVWFTSTLLGEDKDNVIVRSNGSPTYFASDIAYHYDKFALRHFDRVINIWGADHQGHVSRMKAVVGALEVDPNRLQIIICQMVTLKRGEEVIRISKRTGDLVTLREVLDEVGADACRYFFLSRAADSQMDFDLELAKQQSAENPVYYVQYAHARIASILREAKKRGRSEEGGDVTLLHAPEELELIKKMLTLPELVELAATTLEPHHLPHYALDLAAAFHVFYKQCRVISSDLALTKARLKLVLAAKIVLANTLRLMGMTVPEEM